MCDNNGEDEQVVPGISISPSGQATVDSSLANVLFDLAIKLEEPTQLPVDVEHILAAIVMAARQGELDPHRLNANGVYSNKATLAVNP